MLPDDWKEKIGSHDAIYFGAVGDPANVPDHISLWGSLLKFRREFDQYINLRPVKLFDGVPYLTETLGNKTYNTFFFKLIVFGWSMY